MSRRAGPPAPQRVPGARAGNAPRTQGVPAPGAGHPRPRPAAAAPRPADAPRALGPPPPPVRLGLLMPVVRRDLPVPGAAFLVLARRADVAGADDAVGPGVAVGRPDQPLEGEDTGLRARVAVALGDVRREPLDPLGQPERCG